MASIPRQFWPCCSQRSNHPVVSQLKLFKNSLRVRAGRDIGKRNFVQASVRFDVLLADLSRTSLDYLNRSFQMNDLGAPRGGRLQTISSTVQEVVRRLETMGFSPNEKTVMFLIHAVLGRLERSRASPTINFAVQLGYALPK